MTKKRASKLTQRGISDASPVLCSHSRSAKSMSNCSQNFREDNSTVSKSV